MNCKMCNKEFEPSKKDSRIVFCSKECRIKFRNENGYMEKYYKKNVEKWENRQRTQEFKDEKNRARREKYATDETYREKTKEKVKSYNRSNPHIKIAQRLSVYGITPEEYELMLKRQNFKCAICGCDQQTTSHRTKFYVDHCHTTGKIRGLLCNKCNFGIGQFNDDIERMKKAIEYLEANNGKMDSMV